MLAIGRALMSRPKLLLIDEASLGLSPALAKTVFQVVSRINDDGVTVIIVEQNVGVLPYADRALIMEKGTLVYQGVGERSAPPICARPIWEATSEGAATKGSRHMKLKWSALGGQVGIGFVVGGVLLLFLGWNGAASYDRVPAQFPYLISGGLGGRGLMVRGGSADRPEQPRGSRRASAGSARNARGLDTLSGRVRPPTVARSPPSRRVGVRSSPGPRRSTGRPAHCSTVGERCRR